MINSVAVPFASWKSVATANFGIITVDKDTEPLTFDPQKCTEYGVQKPGFSVEQENSTVSGFGHINCSHF